MMCARFYDLAIPFSVHLINGDVEIFFFGYRYGGSFTNYLHQQVNIWKLFHLIESSPNLFRVYSRNGQCLQCIEHALEPAVMSLQELHTPVCNFAVSAVTFSRSVVLKKTVVVAGCPGFFRARALDRRFDGVGAASGDVVQSPARDVVPDDRSLGPDYRGREVEFRRRLVLLLNRQGPGELRRRPSAQVVVNHVGHHFDRRRVLHFCCGSGCNGRGLSRCRS